jgi:hypothetical protein
MTAGDNKAVDIVLQTREGCQESKVGLDASGRNLDRQMSSGAVIGGGMDH